MESFGKLLSQFCELLFKKCRVTSFIKEFYFISQAMCKRMQRHPANLIIASDKSSFKLQYYVGSLKKKVDYKMSTTTAIIFALDSRHYSIPPRLLSSMYVQQVVVPMYIVEYFNFIQGGESEQLVILWCSQIKRFILRKSRAIRKFISTGKASLERKPSMPSYYYLGFN